jgi:hypothetical protein
MDMTREQLEDLLTADDDVKAAFCRAYMPMCQSEEEFYAAIDDAIEAAKLAEMQHNPGALP